MYEKVKKLIYIKHQFVTCFVMVQTTKLMLGFFTTHPVEIVTGLLGNVDWAEGRKEIQPPRTVAFWTSPSVRRQVSRGGANVRTPQGRTAARTRQSSRKVCQPAGSKWCQRLLRDASSSLRRPCDVTGTWHDVTVAGAVMQLWQHQVDVGA